MLKQSRCYRHRRPLLTPALKSGIQSCPVGFCSGLHATEGSWDRVQAAALSWRSGPCEGLSPGRHGPRSSTSETRTSHSAQASSNPHRWDSLRGAAWSSTSRPGVGPQGLHFPRNVSETYISSCRISGGPRCLCEAEGPWVQGGASLQRWAGWQGVWPYDAGEQKRHQIPILCIWSSLGSWAPRKAHTESTLWNTRMSLLDPQSRHFVNIKPVCAHCRRFGGENGRQGVMR